MCYQELALFLLYAFVCQLVFSSSLPHLCPDDQSLALLQFNHMFTINPYASHDCVSVYPKTLSWNKSTDYCSWDGVHCDENTGKVIELDLSCSQIQGKFHSNSSLFKLSNLKRLDLSHNDFSESLISPKFGEFSSLTYLDLSRSSFAGLIPSEISHLSKLYFLRIRSDYKLRFGPHNFELLLKNLTQLRVLDLYLVNISSIIPLNFSSYLTTLQLGGTWLYGILPEKVFHLSNLESLYIGGSPQLTVRFPKTKWNSSASLMNLHLTSVNATGRIPESFSHLTSLRDLDLGYSNLSGPIAKPLWNLTHIEHLILENNHLEGLISQFLRFGKLKELSLGYNNFDGQLECLFFNRSWTQLESLDLSSNSLTGQILSDVSGLQNLQSLKLSSNYLNGTIPSWIFFLPSLYRLYLSDNHFSGKIQEFKSKTLNEVALKQNQLQGPIPNSLLNQQSLEILLLSRNNFSGQISSAICYLKKLYVLDLGSNNLEGTIPQCFGEMNENLWDLDLSNNNLSGTINTTFNIGNKLNVISMGGNKLEGKVPRSLINCKDLVLLDLSNNELNDTFPNWLGTLPRLKILSLRSNTLHGPIKYSGNRNLFAQLQIMDLSSNGFSGNLPASLLGNLKAMKIMDEDTRTPQYVGDIFRYYYDFVMTITTKGLNFDSVRIVTTNMIVDLSRNRFEGHIPNIIGDLVGLRTLNLSHNRLEGNLPTSLQHLSVLESLDLSSNKIGGEIPQQLASLTFLAVLNLSHNHLVGCIPKGKQFDTFENSSYRGNDGLRGLPLSKDCGGDDGVPQATTSVELDQEGGDSPTINWQAVLMGYGCGLISVLSVIYIMLSTQYPTWFSRMFEELEYRIITRMQKHKKRN